MEISAWAERQDIFLGEALKLALNIYPSDVVQLGYAKDSRSLPLSRRGLANHNPMTVGA